MKIKLLLKYYLFINCLKRGLLFSIPLSIILFAFPVLKSYSQTASFTIPDTVCVNEIVNIQNTTDYGSYYSWNFCSPNVNNNATAVNIGNPGGLMNVNVFSDMVIDSTTMNYYMFVTSYTVRNIVRLDFGNSPLNVPTATNLGTFGGVLPTELEGIQIVKDGGLWYGFVVGGQSVASARLVRLDFGANITNVPTATNLGNIGAMQWSIEYQLVKDGANWFGLVANRNNNRISIHNFGTSLANTPTGSSYQLTGAGNSGPCNLMAIKDGANWHVFVTCLFQSVVRLDYGTSLLNVPTQTNFGTLGGALNALPRGIIILRDCNQYVGYLGHENGVTLKLNFNSGLTGPITSTNLGNLSGSNQKIHEFTPITHDGNIHIFTSDYGTNTIQRMNINFCATPVPASNKFTPPSYSYSAAGLYDVSLIVDEGRGIPGVVCKQIRVLNNYNITQNATICVGNSYLLPGGGNATATGVYNDTLMSQGGCDSIITTNLTVTSPIPSIASQTNVTCNGLNNGTATVGVTGGTAAFSYNWTTAPAQTAVTSTGLAPGTYTCTVTDINSCTGTTTVTITEPAILTANIASSTNVSCYGGNNGSATAAANGGTAGYTYSWNTNPAQTGATASNLIAGTYIVTITDANNCTATTSISITQPPSFIATIASSTDVSCYGGNNGSATAAANGGTAGYTYSWNTTPAQTGTTASNLSAGTYIVTVTDANNCTTTASITITEPPLYTATITSSINVSCFGGSNGSAAVSGNGGTPGYTYSWNTNPVQSAAAASNLTAGTYIVTVTDANNCTTTTSVNITEPTLLNASITTSTNVSCFGGSNGSATAIGNNGTPSYTYSWNTTPAQNGATASNLIAGTYIVTVTDSNNCTATATIIITEPSALTASITSSTNVSCFGGNNGSATAIGNNGTPGYTYYWNTAPVQNSAIASNLTAGTYIVTVTDANNCTSISSVTITEPVALTANITSRNVSCNGGSNGTAKIVANGGTPNYTYSWSTNPVQTNDSVVNLIAGTYTCTITDANNCTVTATIAITQPNLVSGTITSTNVTCNGLCNGTASVTATGGVGNYSFSWNTSPVQNTITASGLCAGTYTVTITDNNSCSNTASITITQPTALTLSANSSNVLCNGGNSGAANATASGGIQGGYSYSWNSSPVQNNAAAYNLIAGSYTCTVTDMNGCTATTTVTITEPTALNLVTSFIAGPCDRNNTAIVAVSGGTITYSYSWNTTPVQTTATATNVPAGSYVVTVTDAHGCIKTQTLTIINTAITPTPGFTVDPTSASVLYDPLFTVYDHSINGNTWYWNFGDGTISSLQNPSHTYADTGIYCIKQIVTNMPSGCKDSIEHCVRVEPDFTIYIPNAFTPDDDGINDIFSPKGTGIKKYKMFIFDRWGNRIFESTNLSEGWDGKANGGNQIAQQDVYVYKINITDVKNRERVFTGHFTLIK